MIDGTLIAQTIKNLKKIKRSENAKYRYDGDKEHLYNVSYIDNCIITLDDIHRTNVRGW